MAKRELPIQEFQDLLNVYVSNGWFPWKHKIVKNKELDKELVVQPDGTITFDAHHPENEGEIIHCAYLIPNLFSVESCLHDFVNWKTTGLSWIREGNPPIYDVGYSFHYMNMATLTIVQRMEYFIDKIDMT